MIINRIYEHQTFLSVLVVAVLVGISNYQHPCTTTRSRTVVLFKNHKHKDYFCLSQISGFLSTLSPEHGNKPSLGNNFSNIPTKRTYIFI
jgi:hypothetical protein